MVHDKIKALIESAARSDANSILSEAQAISDKDEGWCRRNQSSDLNDSEKSFVQFAMYGTITSRFKEDQTVHADLRKIAEKLKIAGWNAWAHAPLPF